MALSASISCTRMLALTCKYLESLKMHVEGENRLSTFAIRAKIRSKETRFFSDEATCGSLFWICGINFGPTKIVLQKNDISKWLPSGCTPNVLESYIIITLPSHAESSYQPDFCQQKTRGRFSIVKSTKTSRIARFRPKSSIEYFFCKRLEKKWILFINQVSCDWKPLKRRI